ncbi:hypothetical protein CMO83_04430 [Candidatus Woesearchaeota archaeon]|jgi:hypothetical protein|nr:hypothetical protein [Candidatus Woesearchaeota archaeon]|tara:strand:+ start:17501 stop:17884 length:384 start_codon:yes stop_codon:yes gene_type:complete
MKKSWLKEIARDLLALGSIPFYFLVVIRAIIGKYELFINQMVIAAIAIFILYFVIKGSNLHIARSIPIVVFTSLFYNEMLFAVFAVLVWVLLLVSAFYINRKVGFVIRGLIIGVISSLVGYYGALFM